MKSLPAPALRWGRHDRRDAIGAYGAARRGGRTGECEIRSIGRFVVSGGTPNESPSFKSLSSNER